MSINRKTNSHTKVPAAYLVEEFQLAVTYVKTKKELLEVLQHKLTPILSVEDISIFLLDRSKSRHSYYLHHSIVGRQQQEDLHKISTASYPVDDGIFNMTLQAGKVLSWNIAALAAKASVPDYINYYFGQQLKKLLAVPLLSVQGPLGCVFFLSGDPGAFTTSDELTIQQILPQLTQALTTVIYIEELAQRDRDKGSVLALISAINAVRVRADLDVIVRDQLKQVFYFNDLAIPILNEDRSTQRVHIKYFEKERKISEQYAKVLSSGKCESRDGIVDVILRSDAPVVWSLDEVLQWGSIPPYISFWAENGMKRMAGVPLRAKGEAVGAIIFLADDINAFQPGDLAQLSMVSGQLSIAVMNILASEELEKREYENEILLSLSSEIAAVRNKNDLLTVVKNKIKLLLPFNDLIISIAGKDKIRHRFIESLEITRGRRKVTDLLYEPITGASNSLLSVIMGADQPMMFTADESLKDLSPVYYNYCQQSGVRSLIGVALRIGMEDTGILFLMSHQPAAFSRQHHNLIKSIASQLGIVIANILANEVILEKESEVRSLLFFSNEISAVRDRAQLFTILHRHVSMLIPLERTVILLHDEHQLNYQNFSPTGPDPLAFTLAVQKDKLNYAVTVLGNRYPAGKKGPRIPDASELEARGILQRPEGCGKFEPLSFTIRNGELTLGTLYLFFNEPFAPSAAYSRLLQGIADQVSFPILNIITNEQIVRQDNEKNVLLDISKDIAKIRHKRDLQRLVNDKIMQLLPTDHCLIFKLDETKEHAFLFLDSNNLKMKPDQELSGPDSKPIRVDDELHRNMFAGGMPRMMDTSDSAGRIPEYLRARHFAGLQKILIAPLSDGRQPVGLLMISAGEEQNIDEQQLDLIIGLSSQLAIALSNILANEGVERQMLEISTYKQQLEHENLYLQEEIHSSNNYSEIIGNSHTMNQVFELISRVSRAQSSVLLLGETGTGKELIARAIHNNSPRKGKVMVKINCATLPANLIESELFGHERGSFTGATEKRIGKFELANNSTLFLDEIGELPLEMQAKLLRALQEKEIERVGGRSVIKTDVRVIAATNRDLQKEIQAGNFRSDLFFRLNIFPITVPPLRFRKGDIPYLAAHFLDKHNKKSKNKILGFSNNAMQELQAYDWPGNVRELEHLIERTILMTTGHLIDQLHLPAGTAEEHGLPGHQSSFKTIDEVEREHLIAVLKACNGKVAGTGGAAGILKLPVTTVHSKMKRLGITKKFSTK